MVNHKLSLIQEEGVDCIVNACPFCHLQFDGGQVEIKDKLGIDYNIPVLHYTQLLGLALGFSPEEVGIDLNQVKNSKFLEKLRELAEE